MNRFTDEIVFWWLVTALLLAEIPTILSPSFFQETTEGIVLFPSDDEITLASPASMIATHELVVPRSIPIMYSFAIIILYKFFPEKVQFFAYLNELHLSDLSVHVSSVIYIFFQFSHFESIIVMNNSYKEYSDDFITNHPELFDRVMLKVNATIKLSFEAHSDTTEEDLVKMVRQYIADGGEIVCEMDFTNPNDDEWEK